MNRMSRVEVLKARSDLLRTLREFFYSRAFTEVQTPVLSQDTMVDRSIDPVSLRIDGFQEEFFLQTSPEFAMKRLVLEGVHPIFEITPVFRNAEKGNRHNPEFSMLEWYRVGDSYEQGMELLHELALTVFPHRTLQRVTYQAAFEDQFNINPHVASVDQLKHLCERQKIETPDTDLDRDSLLQILMAEKIEPALGVDSICIVYDWPESQSALAQLRPDSRDDSQYNVAERFELYIDGVEVANGYHELGDPLEQRKRLEENNFWRSENGLRKLPVQSALLSEMSQNRFPECCGVALGVDRLLMLMLGKSSISEVLTFDIEHA